MMVFSSVLSSQVNLKNGRFKLGTALSEAWTQVTSFPDSSCSVSDS